ncbi:histidine phosphatase family protein [Shewanella sp. 10N.286.45.A1]|uniref:histidine phosphatase family protein n=1 Tax=Shewanella sp. 10N.286.45.A1 TaxID=3229694 RepID=UPI003553FE25
MKITVKTLFVFTILMLNGNALSAAEQTTLNDSKSKTVIVVRHAEKLNDGTRDPALNKEGKLRAVSLINAVPNLPLSQAFASNYQRTQLTLKPIAEANNIPINIVATSGGLQAHITRVVELVNGSNGNSLVAGHSNTVPLIISALGGPNITPLKESDYGDLYLLTIKETGEVSLEKRHFGK